MPRTIPQIKRRVECNVHMAQSRRLPIPYPAREAIEVVAHAMHHGRRKLSYGKAAVLAQHCARRGLRRDAGARRSGFWFGATGASGLV